MNTHPPVGSLPNKPATCARSRPSLRCSRTTCTATSLWLKSYCCLTAHQDRALENGGFAYRQTGTFATRLAVTALRNLLWCRTSTLRHSGAPVGVRANLSIPHTSRGQPATDF